jgi:hypothetical protein
MSIGATIRIWEQLLLAFAKGTIGFSGSTLADSQDNKMCIE